MSDTQHWLITGGAGFIGSHLARALVAKGQRVTVLDDLSTGKLDNLSDLHGKICFIKGDVCRLSDALAATRDVDFVLHHAALVSVAESVQQPQKTMQINVGGTQNILQASLENHVKRVVLASSSAVYGNRPQLPYKEITQPDCQSPYAQSKQSATELCQLYTHTHQLPTVILRYFNVFGPGQNPHSPYAAVIAQFMRRAVNCQPLEIDWDGLQSRDFIHVSDVVEANLLAAQKAVPGEIYNVASGHSTTLLELADILEKISGRKLQRVFRPKRPGDVHESSADISKIKALGFIPRVTLLQGLTQMWKELI